MTITGLDLLRMLNDGKKPTNEELRDYIGGTKVELIKQLMNQVMTTSQQKAEEVAQDLQTIGVLPPETFAVFQNDLKQSQRILAAYVDTFQRLQLLTHFSNLGGVAEQFKFQPELDMEKMFAVVRPRAKAAPMLTPTSEKEILQQAISGMQRRLADLDKKKPEDRVRNLYDIEK